MNIPILTLIEKTVIIFTDIVQLLCLVYNNGEKKMILPPCEWRGPRRMTY